MAGAKRSCNIFEWGRKIKKVGTTELKRAYLLKNKSFVANFRPLKQETTY